MTNNTRMIGILIENSLPSGELYTHGYNDDKIPYKEIYFDFVYIGTDTKLLYFKFFKNTHVRI